MNANAQSVSEVRMKAEVTRANGNRETAYLYKNVSKLKTKLWQLRYGKQGERISPAEAAKFDAQ